MELFQNYAAPPAPNLFCRKFCAINKSQGKGERGHRAANFLSELRVASRKDGMWKEMTGYARKF